LHSVLRMGLENRMVGAAQIAGLYQSKLSARLTGPFVKNGGEGRRWHTGGGGSIKGGAAEINFQ